MYNWRRRQRGRRHRFHQGQLESSASHCEYTSDQFKNEIIPSKSTIISLSILFIKIPNNLY